MYAVGKPPSASLKGQPPAVTAMGRKAPAETMLAKRLAAIPASFKHDEAFENVKMQFVTVVLDVSLGRATRAASTRAASDQLRCWTHQWQNGPLSR